MTRKAKLFLLGTVFAVCGAAALFQGYLDLRWQRTAPSELYEVISQQIAAFRAEDFPGAYRKVSMGFQEKVDIEAFGTLARTEYPALLAASRIEFGQTRFQGRHAALCAYFIMPDGDVVPCVYDFVREGDAWKIDGARVLRRWPSNRRLGGLRA